MRLYTIHTLDRPRADVLIGGLYPWLVPGNQTPDEIALEMEDRLARGDKQILLCLAMEEEYLQAFLAAYRENGHVHVWQFRKKKGFPHTAKLFNKVKVWAKDMGTDRLTLHTENSRLRRLYKRKYGFTPLQDGYMEMKL